ncbi:MAG: glycosyltransferase family 2 protein [Candidatus Cloacimonadaceae bacterium]|nr:glycosyltransferase family 2 protein [Candidatus Cloacimonadota bacterium]MDY0326117.1 glycosyltransferase family 2 protein [Candidatus Cloacimonadaceae bacterium]
METDKHLTVIIPAYNEAKGIGEMLKELTEFSSDLPWHIFIINDGSNDETGTIVSQFSGVTLINHPYNKGYGAALKTGILAAETEYIAFYDADGQHNPQDLLNLFENIKNNDMIIGERGKDSHQDWMRKPGKWVLSKTANFLTGRKIPDLNSGLRVIRRESILNLLHLFPDGFSFSTTSTIAFMNMGLFVSYYPITVRKRVGSSTVKQIKHGSNTIMLILRLIVLFNPLKVFIPVSLITFGLGIFYEIYAGVLFHPNPPKLIPLAFFMLITGVLIFFFGLVVDQISEMRKHQFRK